MRRILILVLCALALSMAPQAQDQVIVNGTTVEAETVQALEARYRVAVQPGAYWYDHASGAWGFEGGPANGFIPAGLALGGPLRADASRGRTSVYVNGRRLPLQDLRALETLVGAIQPGRYWLDGQGYAGFEGGPALVNLAQAARQSRGLYRSWLTGTGSNSSGGSGYVMGKDWSVSY